ncbi:MAG: pyridoxamine 5'-phosphate oxidase family protein [Bacillota bacterium]
MRRRELEIKDKNQIFDIIKKARICRLAMSDGGIPYIVAMNFGFEESEPPALYFHCAGTGKKLDILRRNNLVCFQTEVDAALVPAENPCGFSMKYKSVVGMGRARFITDEGEKIKALGLLLKHYSDREPSGFDLKCAARTVVFKVVVTEMSGKKNGY